MSEDTLVIDAPNSSVGDTPEGELQIDDALTGGQERSPEQLAKSASYWQSESDKKLDRIAELEAKVSNYKRLDVLQEQLDSDDSFIKDLAGHYGLNSSGAPVATQNIQSGDVFDFEEGEDGYITRQQLTDAMKTVTEPIQKAFYLTQEQAKAKELLGEDVSTKQIEQAFRTNISEAQKLHYFQLQGQLKNAKRDGALEVNEQINKAGTQPTSVADARANAVETKEPGDERVNEILSVGREMVSRRLDVTPL